MKQLTKAQNVPTAAITVKKSRLKSYKSNSDFPTYYLENGTEFEIELFNPTSSKVLVKIEIDGNNISQGGLVLSPAERVFLDRFLNEAKKFKFDTYEVKNNDVSKNAIKNNGNIVIRFYNEAFFYEYNYLPTYPNGRIRYFNSNLNSNLNYSDITVGTYTTNAFNSSQITHTNSNPIITSSLVGGSKTIETGRIEKGSKSDQEFESTSGYFYSYPMETVSFKILPTSQKITESKELNVRKYCTKCGAKVNKTDNYCGKCGNKL